MINEVLGRDKEVGDLPRDVRMTKRSDVISSYAISKEISPFMETIWLAIGLHL